MSVSAITFYEIEQKVRLGKWDAMAPFAERLVDIVTDDGFVAISLTSDHALLTSLLDWSHCDPFDRVIAAVAMSENSTLLPSDSAFDALEDVDRFWT